MLCGLGGNFWRILSNPPFLMIKGSQIALSWTYFSSPLFPPLHHTVENLPYMHFAPALSDGSNVLLRESGGGEIGLEKLDWEYPLCGGPFPCKCNWLEWWIERSHGRSCVWFRNVQGQLTSRRFISLLSLRWCLLNCPELLFSSSH